MVNAQNVPPALQTLLTIVVGNDWPTGNETALRTLGAAWSDAGTALGNVQQEVGQAWQLIDQALAGASRTAVDSYFTALLGPTPDGSPPVLPTVVQCCDSAADALNGLANEIETLRIEVIGALVVLAIQLAVDLYFAWCGGEVAAEAEIVTTRIFFLMLLRKAVVAMVTRVVESVLAQVGFDLLAQVIELAQHHRGSIDWTEVETSAKNGAIGGMIGFGMGGLGKLMGKGLGKLGGNALGKLGDDGLGGALAKGLGSKLGTDLAKAGWNIGFSSITGMAEGAAQDAADGSTGDYVSGAANGAFSGAMGSFHEHVNPNGKFSISPGDYLEDKLNKLVNSTFPIAHGPGGSGNGGGSAADDISLHTIETEPTPSTTTDDHTGEDGSTNDGSTTGETNDGENTASENTTGENSTNGDQPSIDNTDGDTPNVDNNDGNHQTVNTIGGDDHDGGQQTVNTTGGGIQNVDANDGAQSVGTTGGEGQNSTTSGGNNQPTTTTSNNQSITTTGGNGRTVTASTSTSTVGGDAHSIDTSSSSQIVNTTGDSSQSSNHQNLSPTIEGSHENFGADNSDNHTTSSDDHDDSDSDDDASFDEGHPTLPEIDLGPTFDAAEIIAILNQR
ncbi:hypothetical protein [Streptacidiphilus albus]|uniref:WXG100-like domain-containing protein n=1 Tax=Streptacidiphilus albus TaxID=105425 RepID=UPI00054BB9FC|nr:hypothetical protein [Streptacidiphilus albus]